MKINTPSGKYLTLALALVAPAFVQAATVTLLTNDDWNVQSYRTAGNWSEAQTPSAGNDYVVNALNLYGPGNAGTWVFQGNSLTISSAGYLIGYATNGATLQINNLILNGGQINNFGGALNVAGNMTLVGGSNAFRLTPGKGNVTISAAIGGTGGVTIATSSMTQDSLSVILNRGNTYSGGTTLAANATLTVSADGALGTGNVTLNGGNLKMELGASSNYIADTATLRLASTLAAGAVNLAYLGSDTIARLSLDGGTTFVTAGTWGAIGSGAQFENAVFSGTGFLTVVPEPSTVGLMAIAALGAILFQARFRKQRS